MKDNLKDYIQSHRSQFDTFIPGEANWEKIINKTNSNPRIKAKNYFSNIKLWLAAASVLLLMVCMKFLNIPNNLNQNDHQTTFTMPQNTIKSIEPHVSEEIKKNIVTIQNTSLESQILDKEKQSISEGRINKTKDKKIINHFANDVKPNVSTEETSINLSANLFQPINKIPSMRLAPALSSNHVLNNYDQVFKIQRKVLANENAIVESNLPRGRSFSLLGFLLKRTKEITNNTLDIETINDKEELQGLSFVIKTEKIEFEKKINLHNLQN